MEGLERSPFPAGVLLLNEHLREGGCAAACVRHHRLGHRQHGLHCGVGESCFWSAARVHSVQGRRTERQPVVGARPNVSKLVRLITHTVQLTQAPRGRRQVLSQGHSQDASAL